MVEEITKLTEEELENAQEKEGMEAYYSEIMSEEGGNKKDSQENPATEEERPEVEGILEVADGGFGFLRFNNFLTSEKDIYVAPSQIRRFNLRTGDKIKGISRKPRATERFGALLYVLSVNGLNPQDARSRRYFDSLTPIYPDERITL